MLRSYAEVQAFINDVMTNLGVSAEFAPHADFWNSLSYEQFVDGNAPDITGAPVKILVKGASSQSAIIQALTGEGPFIKPAPGGRFNRMPSGGPFFSEDQIKEIADWIDAGCPQHAESGNV